MPDNWRRVERRCRWVPSRRSLTTATQAGALQTLDITALHTCLTGVSSAVTAFSTSNLQGAVNAITSASPACLSLDNSTGGLVYPFNFPDPFVLTTGTQYFAFGTNAAAGNIQILQSSDLNHWTTMGDTLPHIAAWAQPGATWSPSVLQRGNSYVLYYSALDGKTGDQCISEAVAGQPQGPYLDTSKSPLVCQLDLGGSLDPSPYVGGRRQPLPDLEVARIQRTTAYALGPGDDAERHRADRGNPHRPAHPYPELAGWCRRRPRHVGLGWSVPAVLLGKQLADLRLRHRRGHLQRATRPVHRRFHPTAGGVRLDDERTRRAIGVHRHPGEPMDRFRQLGFPGRSGSPNSRPLFLRRMTESGGVPTVAQ